jgi:hypothetical protein
MCVCDRSPIEVAWSKIENYVLENSLMESVTEVAARLNNRRDCNCDCQHVQQLKQYWEWDGVVAVMINAIIIANPNDSSDGDETSSGDDETEEATNFPHARPLLR